MTANGPEDKTTESSDSRQRWVNEVQEALDRTGDAIRTAWDATRDSRMSAMESAKQAAQELGEVIDKGIAAAKERWSAVDEEEMVDEPSPHAERAGATTAEPPAAGDVTVTPVDTEESDQP